MTAVVARAFPARVDMIMDIRTLRWNNPCLATTKVGSAYYNTLAQDRRVSPIYHSVGTGARDACLITDL